MTVWILLSDGSLGKVELAAIERQPQDKLPIEVKPDGMRFPQSVEDSFKSSAFAAYKLLSKKGLWPKEILHTFSYEILNEKGQRISEDKVCESVGLAFSLALIISILWANTENDLTLAGTGVIEELEFGKVGCGEELAKKFRGELVSSLKEARFTTLVKTILRTKS